MRINTIKGIAMSMIMAAGMTFVSCADWDMPHYGAAQPDQTINNFDFSTTSGEITLNVSYAGCGVKTPVFFELYDEEPITWNEEGAGYEMKEDVKPLFSAYTDEKCVYSGTITLPAYVEKVWVFSPAFFAKTLMEAYVVGNTINVSDTEATKSTRAAMRASDEPGFSYMTRTDVPKEYKAGKRWKEWLGTYDGNGKVNYAYTGKDLVPDASIYTLHTEVINVQWSCPQKYRNAADLEIKDPAEVVITYLGGNTCWNCSLGYYYYKVGQEPKSLEDANVIMIFPNTQDGKWEKMTMDVDRQKAGVNRMTSVKLKYYPKIAQDSQEGATDVFPAGYKVGLVLATNAWSKRLEYENNSTKSYLNQNRYYRSATLNTLSVRQNGKPTDLPVVASYYTNDKKFIVCSFEDDYKFEDGKGYDQNFSDVVVAIGTNPVAAVTDDISTIDLRRNNDNTGYIQTKETLQGTYLFEDLWPQQGDYDMNDACVEYIHGICKDKWNDTYGETFSFKARNNFATKKNGIAFRLTGGKRVAVNPNKNYEEIKGEYVYGYHVPYDVKLYIGGKDATEQLEYDKENQIYYVIPDTKKNPGVTYTVEFIHVPEGVPLHYESDYKKYESYIDVFLYRKEGDKNWEVHAKGQEPTPKMNYDYFGKGDDLSKPEQGIYYVRHGSYPYALFLSGHQIDKMSRLFDIANEGQTLEQMYPKYKKWVESEGKENSDWYK